jgi:PAS domain S-box-containing protein
LEANRQAVRTTGFSMQQVLSQIVSDLHRIEWDRVGEGFSKLQDNTTIAYESVLHTHERGNLPVQVHVRTVQFEGENYLQWTLRDISERKALDALQEDLMAMIYHDLRSPLANIISSLDMLTALVPLDENPPYGRFSRSRFARPTVCSG